jgi:DNA-binding phage protein
VSRIATSRYDVAEHLRSPEEVAAYFQACLDEAKATQAWGVRAVLQKPFHPEKLQEMAIRRHIKRSCGGRPAALSTF